MPIFRIVTINILSDLSRWEERRTLLANGIANLNPDVVALQEVHIAAQTAEWLAKVLDFKHFYISPKLGSAGLREGIAILSTAPLEVLTTLDLESQSRVAQFVQISTGDFPLIIANCHLFWQPGDSPQRIRQVEILLERVKAFPPETPVVICGDFNGTPETRAIRRMKSTFTSAYEAVHGHEPIYTTPTLLPHSTLEFLRTAMHFSRYVKLKDLRPNWRGTLDYIFVNENLNVLDCQVVLEQPEKENSRIYPSDHFGLAATLEIRSGAPGERRAELNTGSSK
jgi:endonuclease/exonuclease/phosphatase family metal-dependent hydrolase